MRRTKAASLLYPRQPAYTVQEVADRLGVAPVTVYAWLQRGKIPGAERIPARIGLSRSRYWHIPHDGLVAFLMTEPPAIRR